jgi:hypothetical protein
MVMLPLRSYAAQKSKGPMDNKYFAPRGGDPTCALHYASVFAAAPSFAFALNDACAAARRATGTRNGEQLT